MRERMDSLGNRKIFGFVVDASNEFAVNLQEFHRQTLQVAKGRLTFAKIVQRKINAA